MKGAWGLLTTGNDPFAAGADGINTLGYTAPAATPLREDFGVIRLDHIFNQKWQFMSSYRYDKTTFGAPVQVDIGGLVSGDKPGIPSSAAKRPLAPRDWVAALA